jgi:hypothetical protein
MRRDFRQGWPDYEARKNGADAVPGMRFELPQWQGQALGNAALLVYGEQGLGDELMFASCLPDLLAESNRVVLYCAPRLEPLFRRSFPQAHVTSGPQLGDPDRIAGSPWRAQWKVGIGSLPLRFRSRQEAFSPRAPYLHADPQRVASWRARLAQLGAGLKVGISWRGGTLRTRREVRSIALEHLAPVLGVPGAKFVSLQYADDGSEVSRLRDERGLSLACFPEIDDDYEQLVGLVGAVDLTISVCTAVVHLAGALGKQVWALVPAVPEWRYMEDGDAMLWYPHVILRRQQHPEDWTSVVQDTSIALARLASGRCS